MAVVMMLLYIAIGSFRNALLMIVNLPFALVGGVIAVLVTGGSLSVGSLVGFVTLFGITIRNSIMLASHYQYLVSQEGLPWNLDVAIQGAQERLPAIMTALVTALAMLYQLQLIVIIPVERLWSRWRQLLLVTWRYQQF